MKRIFCGFIHSGHLVLFEPVGTGVSSRCAGKQQKTGGHPTQGKKDKI